MSTKQCLSCGHTVQAAPFCSVCGAKLQPPEDSADTTGSASGNEASFRRYLLRLPNRAKLIAAGVIVLILAITIPAVLSSLPANIYKKAVRHFANKDYVSAYETIQKLRSDYKDVYILRPYYDAHVDFLRGDYKAAWNEFKDLEPYANSDEMAKESAYRYAAELEEYADNEEGLVEARSIFQELGDYRDAADKLEPGYWEYRRANNLMNKGDYSAAKDIFAALGNYKDSASMVAECDYRIAINIMNNGDYEYAKELFIELGGYSDSVAKINECDYVHAGALFSDGAYAQAKALYDSIPDYADASAKSAECDAQLAQMQERAKEQLIGKWLESYIDDPFGTGHNTSIGKQLIFIDGENLDVRMENFINHCTYEAEDSKLTIYTSGLLGTTIILGEYRFSISADGETLTVTDMTQYINGVNHPRDYTKVAES